MASIAQNLQKLIDTTDDLADAIEAQGGTVTTNYGLEDLVSNIATIPNGNISDVSYTSNTRTLSKTISGTASTLFTCDNTPTQNSNNPITSGAIYSNLQTMNDILESVLSNPNNSGS